MGELYGWIGAAVSVIIAVLVAWLTGRSNGKASVERKVQEQQTRDIIAATKRETTVSREAAHVDQKVNNSTDADVDKQLLDKWSRPGSR